MSTNGDVPDYQSFKKPPYYRGHFLLGALPDFSRDPISFFTNLAHNYGDFVRFRFGPTVVTFLNHPDYAQHILQQKHRIYHRHKFGKNMLTTVLGINLLTSDGDFWLRQRRLMQPAFHRQRISGFGTIMTQAVLNRLEIWNAATKSNEPLDIHEEMMHITLDVVGKALFSIDLSEDTALLGQIFETSLNYINHRTSRIFTPPLFIPTRHNRMLSKALGQLHNFIQEKIDERRQNNTQANDLLAMLLEARDEETGEAMTDEQVRYELATMMAAGHETTALTLSWALYLLSQYPSVEDKLLDELDTVLAGNTPTVDDLPQLQYTRMVIEESMRLYPPSWVLFGREPTEPDHIDGYQIPAKSTVFISPYLMHRDPRFWQNPDQFDPERFSEARSSGRHRFAYLPFGSGPRKCIGYGFALTEAQLVLVTILQHFKLKLKSNYQVEPHPIFTLRIKGGLPMNVTER